MQIWFGVTAEYSIWAMPHTQTIFELTFIVLLSELPQKYRRHVENFWFLQELSSCIFYKFIVKL
jgi:hypothetical protein